MSQGKRGGSEGPSNTAEAPEPAARPAGVGGAGGQGRAVTEALHLCLGPQSFHFPLFMTMLHLAVIFLFSALSRALVQCSSHRARVVLSWPDYLRRVAPTGTCLPVGRREGAAQRGRKA